MFVNSLSQKDTIGSVCVDYEDCSYSITKEMINRGNKRIVFVGTETEGLELRSYIQRMRNLLEIAKKTKKLKKMQMWYMISILIFSQKETETI